VGGFGPVYKVICLSQIFIETTCLILSGNYSRWKRNSYVDAVLKFFVKKERIDE